METLNLCQKLACLRSCLLREGQLSRTTEAVKKSAATFTWRSVLQKRRRHLKLKLKLNLRLILKLKLKLIELCCSCFDFILLQEIKKVGRHHSEIASSISLGLAAASHSFARYTEVPKSERLNLTSFRHTAYMNERVSQSVPQTWSCRECASFLSLSLSFPSFFLSLLSFSSARSLWIIDLPALLLSHINKLFWPTNLKDLTYSTTFNIINTPRSPLPFGFVTVRSHARTWFRRF